MEYPEEIDKAVSLLSDYLGSDTIEIIQAQERIRIFTKLRNLIVEKDADNDQIASSVLGWAYEKLAE
jgi:hypothetical protein